MTTARQAINALTTMYADDLDQPIVIAWWDIDTPSHLFDEEDLSDPQRKQIWAEVCDSSNVLDNVSEQGWEDLCNLTAVYIDDFKAGK